MNPDLEQKIRKYKMQKNTTAAFSEEVDEKRKKLKELTTDYHHEIDNEDLIHPNPKSKSKQGSKIDKVDSNQRERERSSKRTNRDQFIDFKHRRYIENTRQLMEMKNKLTELKHQCEDLKTEVFFEERKSNEMREQLKRQREENEQLLMKKVAKIEEEKRERTKMYEERVEKNMEHIEQLLTEKQKQNQRKVQFIERKKKFQEVKKKIKQKYEEEMKKQKQKWVEEQREKRMIWERSKYEQIEGRTLRNLQPQIQRIVSRSKEQIAKIRDKSEKIIEEFKKIADEQFQQTVRKFNENQAHQLQLQRNKITEENNKKLREQAEDLEMQFEQERIKAKNDYNEEIKALENRRRVESDEFMRKNRYFYVQNLDEIKKIREEYEEQIQELNGAVNKQVEEYERGLSERSGIKVEEFREDERRKLKKRMEEYDKKIKVEIENSIENLSEEIAIKNAAYQCKISKITDGRIKQQKQNASTEIKQLRKNITALQNKIDSIQKSVNLSKKQREDYQTQYLQAKSKNQYLVKKLYELDKEIEELKISESSVEIRKSQRKEQVEKMWKNQIEILNGSLSAIEEQIVTMRAIMKQRENQLIKETNETLKIIEEESENLIQKRKAQQERVKINIDNVYRQRESLEEILKKQMEMFKKYQSRSSGTNKTD